MSTMRCALTIQEAPIDEMALVGETSRSLGIGAVVRFSGVVREMEGPKRLSAIDYEAFEAMARRQFEHIFGEVEKRWPIESVRLVHRIGRVAVGEPSLWVELNAPHRQEAFEALAYLIDEMKKRVPIWKHLETVDAT